MRLDGFIKETSSVLEEYSLSPVIIAKTDNAVKIKAQVSDNISLQFYYNQKAKTRNYVLVGWSRRLYGRDSVGGEWHRHPSEKPEEHDFSEEGSKETSPGEFVREAFEVLKKAGLL